MIKGIIYILYIYVIVIKRIIFFFYTTVSQIFSPTQKHFLANIDDITLILLLINFKRIEYVDSKFNFLGVS